MIVTTNVNFVVTEKQADEQWRLIKAENLSFFFPINSVDELLTKIDEIKKVCGAIAVDVKPEGEAT